MPTQAQIAQRLTSLFGRTSTPALITSLVTLEASPTSPERSWARAKTIEELERRFPAAAQVVAEAFEMAEQKLLDGGECEDVDYVAVLLAAIEASK